MKKIFCASGIVFLALLFFACQTKTEKVVSRNDVAAYLKPTSDHSELKRIDVDLNFWLQRDPESSTSLIKRASLYAARFKVSANIDDIHISDSLYERALRIETESASLLQAMASNAITQHQFWKADDYLNKALAIGNNKAASYLMKADVQLELGNPQGASAILQDFKNKGSFAWLIREAKIKDHEGKLDSAILLMERSFDRIKGSKALFCWTKSNLADMYGHAGRVSESYHAYLDVLKVQPDYDYALKGIAWVAFSNDHNTELAKEILNFIKQKRNSPDVYLQLSEIAAFEKDTVKSEEYLSQFATLARDQRYGEMYNSYLAAIEADEFQNADVSFAIAQREISNRPTPQSYDMKAWALYRQGKYLESLELAREYVEGKSFEPEVVFHLAMIYKANQQHDKARKYLEQAMESSYELGPVKAIEIRKHLEG